MSGLAAYDRVLFSMHVVQHVLLGMAAPILLVLGRPVTLALQASSRPTQARLLAVMHSRPVRAVTNPVVAWALFAGTLVALYFTGLYELSLRNGWVHAGLHLHFVLVGVLFLAFVVGLDPIPGAMSYGARALFVFVFVPFHAFLGVALLGSDRVIGGDWYRDVERSWGASPLVDQRTGAGSSGSRASSSVCSRSPSSSASGCGRRSARPPASTGSSTPSGLPRRRWLRHPPPHEPSRRGRRSRKQPSG